MHFKVLVQSPNNNPWEWTFHGASFRIGRNPEADLTLDGPDNKTVSWNHLEVDGSGAQVILTDLGSSNGTYLEGTRVQNPVPWALGQTISLGRSGPRLELIEVEDPERSGRPNKKPEDHDTWSSSQPQTATLSGKEANSEFQRMLNPQTADTLERNLEDTNKEKTVPTSQTRQMVLQLQHQHRRTMMALVACMVVLVLLLAAGSAYVMVSLAGPADVEAAVDPEPTETEPANGLTGDQIYDQLLKSTVLVWRTVPDGAITGTGALIDLENRYVITNFHVVGEAKYVNVNFPEYGRDGKEVINNKEHYFKSSQTIPGEVIKPRKHCDLALIQLRRLPDGVEPLKLAQTRPKPGSPLHLVGNPGASEGLWVYTSGEVRNIIPEANFLTSYADGTDAFEVNCRIIEAQTPSNAGDSGAPMVNNQVELVAINQSALLEARLMSNAIDVAEVKDLLESLPGSGEK